VPQLGKHGGRLRGEGQPGAAGAPGSRQGWAMAMTMKRLTRMTRICVLGAGLAAGAAGTSAETALLRGGASLTAPVLRLDDEAAIFDLGHTLLRVPRAQIVALRPDAPAAEEPSAAPTAAAESGSYVVSDAKVRLGTEEAVRRTAPSVALVRTPRGMGSGFFVNRKGLLITNFHVIAGSRRIAVTQFVPAEKGLRPTLHNDVEIVAVAPFYDLAVLRIKGGEIETRPALFPRQDDTRAGERIFVIGNPMGLEQTVTEGVVSQPHRHYAGLLYRQIDAPVNPGNSGGPLFNGRGQVVGVINARIPYMDGLGFAIPARHAQYVLDHLEAFAFDVNNPESGFVYPDPPPPPGGASATAQNE